MTLQDKWWWALDGLQAATPVVVGLVACYVAWRQMRTDRNHIKLDLFDRRFKVYSAALRLIQEIRFELQVTDETKAAFRRDIGEAKFIFPPEIDRFLSELLNNALALRSSQRQQDKAATNPEAAKVIDLAEQQEKEKRVTDWADKNEPTVFDKFLPYLDFQKWK